MDFYIGLNGTYHANKFGRCMINVNRLWNKLRDFKVNEWILDSGAFSELSRFGHYRPSRSVEAYAAQIIRWSKCGILKAAVCQDYMCEPFILQKTGMEVIQHQILTFERYNDLVKEMSIHYGLGNPHPYIMPVLQGYHPGEYVYHLEMYGLLLQPNMWVGVGSVCKRNSNPTAVLEILNAIKKIRPDLRLHGFGLKKYALENMDIRNLLESSDSMAYSWAAYKEGRDHYDYKEALRYYNAINTMLET